MNTGRQAPAIFSDSVPRIFTLICFFVLVAGSIAAANDPWKSKSYKEWTEKDVEKVLTDSPWVRTINTSLNGVPTGRQGATGGDATPDYGPGGGSDDNGGLTAGRPSAQNPPQGDAQPAAAPATPRFAVFWESSRTIREALARRQILQGKMNEADAEKYLAQPQDDYQLVLQGDNMSVFQKYDERFTQENSILKLKKSKAKIAPAHVEFQKAPSGAIDAVIFSFPRKLSSGAPLILADEKSIEFTCKLGGVLLDAGFDPQKMADQTGPDF
jgi:hypothetical protein